MNYNLGNDKPFQDVITIPLGWNQNTRMKEVMSQLSKMGKCKVQK
jgi:hypothetical protein